MNTKERTLVLIKPDAIEKSLVSLIKDELEAAGLIIIGASNITFDVDSLKEFYGISEIKYPNEIVEQYLCSQPLQIWIVEGEGSINKVTKIKYRMRHIYGSSRLKNLFHCPDSKEEFGLQYNFIEPKSS